VSPDVQRLGVGRKLYSAFEELMMEEKVRMLIIDTQADNVPAIRFFTSMGFGSQSDHFYFSRKAEPIPETLLAPHISARQTRASAKKFAN